MLLKKIGNDMNKGIQKLNPFNDHSLIKLVLF